MVDRKHNASMPEKAIRNFKVGVTQLLQRGEWKAESQRLRRFKSVHKGKRCFILGNGPSILEQDLNSLKGEISFVTNYFPLSKIIDDLTPDYYCFSDWRVFASNPTEKFLKSMANLPSDVVSFFPMRAHRGIRENQQLKPQNLFFLNYVSIPIWERKKFGFNIEKAVYTGDTIIIDFCLPLAMYMGFSEIYLLGCDMNYVQGHFYDGAFGNKEPEYPGETWYKNVIASYELVKDVADQNGISIYNATNGGNLEIFPRRNLERAVV